MVHSIDPTKIHIDSSATPSWEQAPESFQDLMAEKLRHAPWLMVSLTLHAVALLVLWIVMPQNHDNEEENFVHVQLEQPKEIVEPLPPPEPEPIIEEQPIDPELMDAEVEQDQDTPLAPTNDVMLAEPTVHDFTSSPELGLNGPPAGKYSTRGKGGGGRNGGKAPARSIELGLKWLRDHQDEDGKWDSDGFMKHDEEGEPCDGAGNGVHDVGATGLALLAFLGEGSTMRSGPYRENIKNGVRWLRANQQDNGLFGTNASNDYIYGHAIAAYAMCEAYGLSNYTTLKRYAQKGLNYLESHRNPYSVWGYQPRGNGNDTSVTGWCIMAYESGKYFDLQVNDNALKLCNVWLDQVTDSTGRAGYRKVGEPSSRHPGDHMTRFPTEKGEAMTAVSLFCRFFMGQDPKEKTTMTDAANLIMAKPPVWDEQGGSIDHYYWYYATYAMYQMGGDYWKDWSKKVNTAVVKNQRLDGNFTGSWDPVGVWGDDGGRVYSTATLVLTLQAYYRYTTLVR